MKIIYNAIVLTPESQRKLMEVFSPKFDKTFYHHVTLNFGKQEFPDRIGETVPVRVVGYGEDNKAQAVVVDIPILSDNANPHITLSVDDGVKPVYSNEMLKTTRKIVDPFNLEGIVKSFVKDGGAPFWTTARP